MTSLVVVSVDSALASIAARSSGSMRTGTTSAGPDAIAGRPHHRVNHELDRVVEVEPDDLHEVASRVGVDRENFGRISVGIEFRDGDGVVDRVQDRQLVVAVLER